MPNLTNGSSCPSRISFNRNVIMQQNNITALLMAGLWNESQALGGVAGNHFEFDHNLWFSQAQDLRTAAVFGGDNFRHGVRGVIGAGGFTFAEWQAQGRDTHSDIG